MEFIIYMVDEKIDNLLNLALNVTDSELEKGYDLDTGYDSLNDTWEVIVKYNTSLDPLLQEGITVTYLYGGYAVLVIPRDRIDYVAALPVIEYMEKPKSLYFAVNNAKHDSCFDSVQRRLFQNTAPGNVLFSGLTGKGTIVAVIDSGFDIFHPDFINNDGTSRILFLWDQSDDSGMPPEGYNIGTQYSREAINELINGPYIEMAGSEHGTHVLGIAAGNGRASRGRYAGCAPECDIIAVKLGTARNNSFPMTSKLIQAIDYSVRKAYGLGIPVAVNISYGNNYGSHAGNSLLEDYIANAASVGRSFIVVGTGNEGISGRHTSGRVGRTTERVEIAVYEYTSAFSVQIWKNYYDKFNVVITAPDGSSTGTLTQAGPVTKYRIYNTDILVYYGEPTPYSVNQEIYIDMSPEGDFFNGGIWTIELIPEKIVSGEYYMWLPAGSSIYTDTLFLNPAADTTLTIPSTAGSVMSVGAYDSATDSIAPFSGRGYTTSGIVKPEIVAPGVDIISAAPRGGYTAKTGTSMATPFVTGAASCLMQWGIIDGNDPYLYADKLKAYLIAGARKLPGFDIWPNPQAGWGALCISGSIP